MADPDHPYGYTNMRYVSSLISGVGIFCVGSGLSFYHGVTGILDPQPLHDFYWVRKHCNTNFIDFHEHILIC